MVTNTGSIAVSIKTNTIPIINSKTITNCLMVSIVFFQKGIYLYIKKYNCEFSISTLADQMQPTNKRGTESARGRLSVS